MSCQNEPFKHIKLHACCKSLSFTPSDAHVLVLELKCNLDKISTSLSCLVLFSLSLESSLLPVSFSIWPVFYVSCVNFVTIIRIFFAFVIIVVFSNFIILFLFALFWYRNKCCFFLFFVNGPFSNPFIFVYRFLLKNWYFFGICCFFSFLLV